MESEYVEEIGFRLLHSKNLFFASFLIEESSRFPVRSKTELAIKKKFILDDAGALDLLPVTQLASFC